MFLEILNDIFLTQLNFIPTHGDRLLDLVITNVPDRFRVREVLSPKESDVFTDHGTVSFEFHASTKATHKIKRTVYDYRNGDFEGPRGALEALNSCNLIQDSDDINLDWNYWTSAFMSTVSDFIPTKKIKGKKHASLDHKWNHPRSGGKGGCLLNVEEISYWLSTIEVSRYACKGQDSYRWHLLQLTWLRSRAASSRIKRGTSLKRWARAMRISRALKHQRLNRSPSCLTLTLSQSSLPPQRSAHCQHFSRPHIKWAGDPCGNGFDISQTASYI